MQRASLERLLFVVLRPVVAVLFRLRVSGGLPAGGPLIVAANHVSYLDPVVLAVLLYGRGRPPRFLTTRAVFDLRLVGPALRRTGLIPVGSGLGALRAAAAALEAGETVVVYPEGHVAVPGVEHRARAGVAVLARLSGAPVVPLASWGLEPARRRLGWLRRRRAAVVLGAPLPASSLRGRDGAERVLAAIRVLRGQARALAEQGDFPSLEDGARTGTA